MTHNLGDSLRYTPTTRLLNMTGDMSQALLVTPQNPFLTHDLTQRGPYWGNDSSFDSLT
jgi:hypothetical protein